MKRTFAAICLGLFLSAVSVADIARPEKPKNGQSKEAAINTELSISLDKNAKEARLLIPRSQLRQLRAELEGLGSGADETASVGGVTRIQTIVGGVFMSLAFVLGGFAFIRSGRFNANAGRAAAAAAIVFAGGAFATIAFGNAGPPNEARSITGKMFAEPVHIYGFGWGRIKLEVSDEVKNPKLIVPNPPDARRPAEE